MLDARLAGVVSHMLPSRRRTQVRGRGFTMRTSVAARHARDASSEPHPSPSAFMCVDSAARRRRQLAPDLRSRPRDSSIAEVSGRRASSAGRGSDRVSRAAGLRFRASMQKTAPEASGAVSNIVRVGPSRLPRARRCRSANSASRRGSRSPTQSPSRRPGGSMYRSEGCTSCSRR